MEQIRGGGRQPLESDGRFHIGKRHRRPGGRCPGVGDGVTELIARSFGNRLKPYRDFAAVGAVFDFADLRCP